MATELLDIQEAEAVPRPESTVQHQEVTVNGNVCRGGINITALQREFSTFLEDYLIQPYLAALPPERRIFNMADAEESIQHLRCYTDPENAEKASTSCSGR
ncbi:uncharacterized protein LOC125561237 [Nematostella vectensis]|uniref:uncharacterized protein LOC125561237 n=1 Tax=Nematostella vectensis TaxID=45351 RepID=UPI002076D987|nr:uncharacterized protein LOC125561237 [Nematostella vectensis]